MVAMTTEPFVVVQEGGEHTMGEKLAWVREQAEFAPGKGVTFARYS